MEGHSEEIKSMKKSNKLKLNKLPSILYKYRDFNIENHRLILNGEIFISGYSNLNDPFEGNLPFNQSSIKNHDKLCKELYCLYLRSINDKFDTEINNETNYIDFIKNYISKNLGVFCLSTKNDNILMWTHYANNQKGFVIGFDTNILIEKLGTTFDFVKYVNRINNDEVSKMKTITEIPFIKFKQWSYETEFRFVYEDKNKVNKPFSKSLIKSIKQIIFGLNMSEIDKNFIKHYCINNLPNIELYQVHLNKDKIKLDIIEIK